IGEHYLCSWGQVLDSVIPAGVKKQAGTREILSFQLAEDFDLQKARLTPKQQSVVDVLNQKQGPVRVDELTELAGCGTSPIETLRKKGILVPIRKRSHVTDAEIGPVDPQPDLKLNPEQSACLNRI